MVGVGIVSCLVSCHGCETLRYLILHVRPWHSIAKDAACCPKVLQQAAGVSSPTIGSVYSPPFIAKILSGRSQAVLGLPPPQKGPPTGRPGFKPRWVPPLRDPP